MCWACCFGPPWRTDASRTRSCSPFSPHWRGEVGAQTSRCRKVTCSPTRTRSGAASRRTPRRGAGSRTRPRPSGTGWRSSPRARCASGRMASPMRSATWWPSRRRTVRSMSVSRRTPRRPGGSRRQRPRCGRRWRKASPCKSKPKLNPSMWAALDR